MKYQEACAAMIRHAPGPWSLSIYNSNIVVSDGYLVCDCSFENSDEAMMNANARLISATPDLLRSLLALMEFWDNGSPVHPGAEVVSEARAAIAKAVS